MEQATGSEPERSGTTETANRPPWSLSDIVMSVVGGVVSGFAVIFVLAFFLRAFGIRPSESFIYLLGGSVIYLMVGLMIWLVIIRGRKVSVEALGFRWVGPTALLLMIPATLVLLFISGIVAQLTSQFINDVPDAQDQLSVASEGGNMSVVDLICILIVVAIIGPVIEEVVFRGLLQQYVRARRGVAIALLISSLAFSIIHFIPALLLVFFVMGFIYGWIAEYLKSLYPAILLHSLNNAASTLIVFALVN